MTEKEWEEWVNWRKTVDAAIERLHGGQRRLVDKLAENTALTAQTKVSVDLLNDSLGGFPEFMKEGQQTFKFVKRLITLIKWGLVVLVGPIAAMYFILYGVWHEGHAPEWLKLLWKMITELNK